MLYPAVLEPDGSGWRASFPDIPEALTSGATREEALEMAHDALIAAMDFYFESKRAVPTPSAVKRGQEAVSLTASLTAKVLLLNEMMRQKVGQSELARRIGSSPQELNRITNLRHTTKVDVIENALQALGRRLDLRVVED